MESVPHHTPLLWILSQNCVTLSVCKRSCHYPREAACIVEWRGPRYSYKRHSKLWSALWRLRLFEGCDLSYKVWFERLKKAVNVLGLWFAVNYSKLYYPLMTYVQWTDEGTVAIMESLSITDGPSIIREKFLILAYRDNEIDKKHPLQLMLNRAKSLSSHVHATVINQRNSNELVPAVLQQDIMTVTKSLADVVYQKTNGNPFHTLHFLEMLQEERFIFLSPLTMKCDCGS